MCARAESHHKVFVFLFLFFFSSYSLGVHNVIKYPVTGVGRASLGQARNLEQWNLPGVYEDAKTPSNCDMRPEPATSCGHRTFDRQCFLPTRSAEIKTEQKLREWPTND